MTDGPSPPVALVIALTLAVGGLVVSTITGLVGTVGGALVGAGTNPDAAVPVLVGVVLVTSEAGFLLVGYAFRQTDDGGDLVVDWIARHGPSVRDAGLIAVATAGLAAFNRLAFAVGSLFGVDPTTAVSAPEELTAAVLVFVIPAMLFAVGPAEEYLFRGVIQGYLRESFSARGAVGWSSVLFTLVHLPNLVANPESAVVSIPVWLAIGVVLGWLYERTGALLVPIAVHGLYNTIVIALLFAEWGLL
ncbi:CPBP family intramembrane metalloprotease [Halolamina sp. CBA1230]|uniref:CPBP family intramembrane glutamic endopeptidase n=1 Tax=Halolamina sp. CBA1230 TaxID=1853690 RepID=UPI00117B4856|nr:CPBP family intramembrane glutamic endopeptidase [Halolamina sp. CBA1230]QKY20213.1 CPBP family intramembrane metalloprotease [Halolamina sp. CBA1230]